MTHLAVKIEKCAVTYLISFLLLIVRELIYYNTIFVVYFFIVVLEASIISLDCNHGVCPQTQGAVTCTITGSIGILLHHIRLLE